MTYMVVRAYRDGQYVAGQSPVAPDQVDAVKDAFANRYPGTVLRVAPCSYQPPPVAPAAAETEGVDGSELGNLLTIFRSDKLGIEVDVNGHVAASAGIRLGTGDPVHVTDPQDIGAYANLPGYLRLAADMRSKHPAWQGLRAGETIAITTANWLVKYGFDPPQVSEA